ncbi:hypothetical protein V2W45_1471173 [Cenococcum geophilum]
MGFVLRETVTTHKDLLTTNAVSILSGTTINALELSFTPTKSFYVNAKGIIVLYLPTPYIELVSIIYNFNSSITYASTREYCSLGNYVLTNAIGHQLIIISYFFSLGKDLFLIRLNAGKDEDNVVKIVLKRMGFRGLGKKGTTLILTKAIRTLRSKSYSAENSRELVLGEGVGGKDSISKELIIATCLLILKKEIDRRTVQFMMIASA